jgi:hypothetical protein
MPVTSVGRPARWHRAGVAAWGLWALYNPATLGGRGGLRRLRAVTQS